MRPSLGQTCRTLVLEPTEPVAAVRASGTAEQVIELLLAAGANPNLPGPNGWTPLHCAAHGYTKWIHLWVAKGAKTTAVDSESRTPPPVRTPASTTV